MLQKSCDAATANAGPCASATKPGQTCRQGKNITRVEQEEGEDGSERRAKGGFAKEE